MRILIVTDYSTSKVGGAQVIANLVGERLEKAGYRVVTLVYPYSKSRTSAHFFNKVKSLINPIGLLLTLAQQIRFRPDIIWYHSISTEWSYSTLKINPFRSKQILTVHDLSIISNFKITPEILEKYNSEKSFKKMVRTLRLRYLKFCLSKCTTVGIGDLCVATLRNFGVRIDYTIKNRVMPCAHENPSGKIKNSVLFAGREYLKGLEQIASAIKQNPNWKLFLAGDIQLLEYASMFCPKSQIEYLGRLSQGDLFEFLHKMELVAVCSQCFDNYPTIALEALAHNSLPFTTDLTGVADLLARIHPRLVLKRGEFPPLEELRQIVLDHDWDKTSICSEVTDVEAFIYEYLEVMDFQTAEK